jgi:hypothetical protein
MFVTVRSVALPLSDAQLADNQGSLALLHGWVPPLTISEAMRENADESI